MARNSIITGTGSYIPDQVIPNAYFSSHSFYDKSGKVISKPVDQIVEKLEVISGIRERKYVSPDHDTADIAVRAANLAIKSSGIPVDDLDGLIVAHNFGNISPGHRQGKMIPNLAAVVKGRMNIQNPKCFAYDILFGCPGWLEALIIGHQYLQNQSAENLLIIGVEVISRVLDPHDMDSMLFGDGAGAVVLSAETQKNKRGILGSNTYSHCGTELDYLKMGESLNSGSETGLTPKMEGKNVYKYAVQKIPELIDECLVENGIEGKSLDKFLLHQANEKMIMAIAKRICDKYEISKEIDQLVPFMVQETGNSSVATIPTLIDFIMRNKLQPHNFKRGDIVVMASVGAGMHCNCVLYKF